MLNRLIGFLGKIKLFTNTSLDFKKICQPLLQFWTSIHKNVDSLDEDNLACLVFLDFAKAFETIDHKILISKLENYEHRGTALQWFWSYISNREQVVKIGNVLSETRYISHGIPQGGILGKIIFLLYINDIKTHLSYLNFSFLQMM